MLLPVLSNVSKSLAELESHFPGIALEIVVAYGSSFDAAITR